MGNPIDRLIETLTETRARLDEQLGHNEAYRALMQLEQRETLGERLSIVSASQLRQALKAELSTDSCFKTRCRIDESLAMLGAWSKAGIVLPPVAAETADEAPADPHPQASVEPAPAIAEAPEPAEPPPALVVVAEAVPDAAALPPDDLTLVRDLPVACINVVAAAGYGRYETLAAIDSAGVALLERLLGQHGIVSRGNWIEQAAVLARGNETLYAARLIALRTGAEWPPQPHAPEIIAPPPALEPVSPAAVALPEPEPLPAPEQSPIVRIDPRLAEPHDLTHIAGIDRTLAERLAANSTTFAQMSAWTAKELTGVAAALGIAPSRISQEGWIEQAALLAAGRITRHLDRKPVAAPLATLPPPLAVPLDEEPELAVEAAEAVTPTEPAAVPSAERIVVPAAANDDPPPHEAIEPVPAVPPAIWPAAAAKAAILRPLRKPSDRGDKAFDDVAALVAQTVATARNVGGMSERAERPAPPAPQVARPTPLQAEPPRPAAVAKPLVTASAPAAQSPASHVSPRAPASPPVAAPPVQPGTVAPHARAPEPDRSPSRVRALGSDPEASIEIRPRETAAPSAPVAAQPRANGIVRAPTPGMAATPARSPAPGGPAKTLVATSRAVAPVASTTPSRRVVVIDEIARDAAPVPDTEDLKPSGVQLAARATGLFNRFVKALKGDAPD